MKAEIYARLAELIEECSEKVKICTPSADYYRRADEWCEDTITVVNTYKLVDRLMTESRKEEE